MTEKSPQADQLTLSLHEGLARYVAERKTKIPTLLDGPLGLRSCVQLQSRHVVRDLFCNPVNTLWAIPYLSVRKVLELCEKLGMEFPSALIPAIPRSARTEFQKEVERRILTDLFGFPADHGERSALADALERDANLRPYFETVDWQLLRGQAEREVRHLVTEYCNARNGFTDLVASGAIVLAAQTFFGDRSLDVFAMGRRWAALWSRQKAVSHFFLGHKIGNEFYKIVRPPAPTANQVYLATGIALGLLALFSTAVAMVSYPVQSGLGFQERQLEKLLNSLEDKLLVKLSRAVRPSPRESI